MGNAYADSLKIEGNFCLFQQNELYFIHSLVKKKITIKRKLMPVPKRKRSRCRRDKRFANKGMVVHAITSCANCEQPLIPHIVCRACGFYKGIKVMKTKIDRIATRINMRQARQASRKNNEQQLAQDASLK